MDSLQRKNTCLFSPFLLVLLYLSAEVQQINCSMHERDFNGLHEGISSGCFATLCNETENYPYDEIKDAIDKHPEFHLLFGNVLSLPSKRYRRAIEREDAICEAERTKIYPRVGLDSRNNVDIIVNVDGYKQEVPYVQCLNKKCHQVYKLVKLVVLDDKNDLSTRRFKVPVRCQLV